MVTAAVVVAVTAVALAAVAPVAAATAAVLVVAVDAPVAAAVVVTAAAVAATKLLPEWGQVPQSIKGLRALFLCFGGAAFTGTPRKHFVVQSVRQQTQQLGHPAHLPRNNPVTGARRNSAKSPVGEIIGLH